MAYITTQYDYDLKQEVFKVTGEKGYSHKTDTILKRVTLNDGTFKPINDSYRAYYTIEFTLTVLNDIGVSKIAFYDNDEIIPFKYKTTSSGSYGSETDLLEWTDQMGTIYVQLALAYEVEHTIQARYLGNTHGLPSRSLTINTYSDLPAGLTPELHVTDGGLPVNDELIVPSGDDNYHLDIYFYGEYGVTNKQIYAYFDNDPTPIELDLTTGSLGYTHIEVPEGETSVRLVFEGDRDYVAVEKVFKTYIGTKKTITLLSDNYVAGQEVNVEVILEDYKGNPITNNTVSLIRSEQEEWDAQGEWWLCDSKATDSNGRAILTDNEISVGTHYYHISNTVTKVVIRNDVNVALSVTNFFNTDEKITGTGKYINATARVDVSDNTVSPKGFEITFTGAVNQKVITDNNGEASVVYNATGVGNTFIKATIGDMYQQVNFQDVIQYWNVNGSINKQYTRFSGNFQELTNYYHLEQTGANSMAVIGLGDGVNQVEGDWTVTFKVVGATNSLSFYCGNWFDGTIHLLDAFNVTLKTNDNVVMSRDSDYVILNVNGNEVGRVECSQYSKMLPLFGIIKPNGTGSYLNFNNLVFKRL